MNRVLHHGVVDENEAHTLTEFQMDWLSLRKLIRVETPDEPHHIAGEVKNDFASRRSAVHAFVERAEVGHTSARDDHFRSARLPDRAALEMCSLEHWPPQGQGGKELLLPSFGLGEASSA